MSEVDTTPNLEALRVGYERYRAIFQMLPDGITVSSLEGIIQTVNPAAVVLFGGADEGAFIGRSILDFLQPQEAERAIANQRKTLSGADPGPDVYQGRRLDGSLIWLELHGELLRDAAGEAESWLFIARNIDAQRRAELALRERETFLQAIIDHSPLGISVRDPSGRLLRHNAAWARIWAMDSEELSIDSTTPRNTLNFDQSDDYLSPWQIELRRVYEQGGTLFLPELKTSGKRPGMAEWVSQYFYALRGEDGRVSQVVILTEDTSERKRAESALLESMQSSADLVQAIPVGLMIFSYSERDGFLVTEANPTAERLIGLRISQIRRKPLSLLWPRQEELIPHLLEVFKGGEPFEIENREFDNGLWRGTLTLRAFRLPGERLAVIFKDTTENTRLTREKRELEGQVAEALRLESIARLAGGLAHTFNNQLTGISGHLELLLLDLPEDDPLHSRLAEINQAAHTAAELTRELLAFSRQQRIVPQPLDLNEILKTRRGLFKRLLGPKIRLRVTRAAALPLVNLDAEQVTQMLLTLLLNARAALPEGGQVAIESGLRTIQVEPQQPATHWVQLRVSDSADPLPEEARQRLFEPFFSSRELGRGTGLGLAALYGAVTQNDGRIEVQSHPTQGTSYVLSFVAQSADESGLPRVAESQTPEPKATAQGEPPLLLLAEDEPIVRTLTTRVLTRLGYSVMAAGDGAKTLEMARALSRAPLLLLADVELPDQSGPRLHARLCELFPGLPVLFMSGYPRENLIQRELIEPGQDYLAKPFTPQQLSNTLSAILAELRQDVTQ